MTFTSLLPLFSSAVIFSSGLWALISFPTRRLTRLFLVLCLLGGLWSFSLYEIADVGESLNSPWGAFGFVWLFIFPLQLHFVFLYSEIDQTPIRKFFVFVIYLISFVFFWLISSSSTEIWLHIWPLFLALGSLVSAGRLYLTGSVNRPKTQELLVFLGTSAGLIFCVGLVLDQYLELEFDYIFPVIFSVEVVLISVGLIRYDLIKLSLFMAMENIMETLTDAVILTTSGGMIVTANRAALDILGYKEIDLVDQPIGSVVGQVWKGDFLPGEDEFGIEMALIAKDKSRIPIALSTSVVAESNNSPLGVVFVARDLTKRVQAQEQLIVALKEKEILLKETHHRVKNNLQVISSLLSLQSDYVADTLARKALEESRNRVFSMAVVHELLYQSEDLREIDFKDYTDRMIDHVIFSHNVDPGRITFQVQIADVSLDLDTASYIGLVINELIVNALTHGFPDGRSGGIWVDLMEAKNGIYELTIKDDGIGLPSDFKIHESESLGLQLVSMVAEQIGGELVIENGGGTTFRLIFHRLDDGSNE